MGRRKDATIGAARAILEVSRVVRTGRPLQCPHIEVYPNVRGVIPDEVKVSCDLRHREHATIDEMEADLRGALAALAKAEVVAEE